MSRAEPFLRRLVKALAAGPGPTPPSHGPSLTRRFINALACRTPRS